jgi:O-phosphoseryl-tRNA(Cys) synthetase
VYEVMGERTKSAVIVALTHKVERQRDINRKLDKRVVRGEWQFYEQYAILVLNLDNKTLYAGSWYYTNIRMYVRNILTLRRTKKCIKFVEELQLPEGTNIFNLHTHDARIYYGDGMIIINDSGIREHIMHEKDGFDIMRQLIKYCSDRGRPIPTTIEEFMIVDPGGPDVADPDIAYLGEN